MAIIYSQCQLGIDLVTVYGTEEEIQRSLRLIACGQQGPASHAQVAFRDHKFMPDLHPHIFLLIVNGFKGRPGHLYAELMRDKVRIEEVCINPQLRRRGLAAFLLKAALQHFGLEPNQADYYIEGKLSGPAAGLLQKVGVDVVDHIPRTQAIPRRCSELRKLQGKPIVLKPPVGFER